MQSVIFIIAAVSASSYSYERKLESTGMYFQTQKLTDNLNYGSCYANAFTYYTSFKCDSATPSLNCVQSYCDSMIDPTDTSAAVAKAT